jgi:hypothetical protein
MDLKIAALELLMLAPAYTVEGEPASTAREYTGAVTTSRLNGFCVQVAPPSVLLKTPLSVPAYRMEGELGAIASEVTK